jgi:hypothetical protein
MKMIEASQRILTMNGPEEKRELRGGGINLAIKRHLELEIKTLKNAPRDAGKLRLILEVNQRKMEEAMHIEDIQRLITENRLKCLRLHFVFGSMAS